ncbi:MAG: hypothetical protein WA979_09155 [Pacificimonas sp.]
MSRTSALEKRLAPYWKMEAGSAVLIPVVMWWLAEGRLGWATILALPAMVFMLLVGALYWWAKLRQLRGETSALPESLSLISRVQTPILLLTGAAVTSAASAWLFPEFAIGQPDRWCATAAAVLAVLEYVNYYHRQLQHFDHAADFRRLLSGRGFRRAQMRQDLDRWRARSGA